MKPETFTVGAVAVAMGLLMLTGLTKGAKRQRKATGEIQSKQPLTEREQAMYFRLRDTFPNLVVLAQVAFSALVTSKDAPTRATFNRKMADFVLCDRAFAVIAVIELDDASHRGREGDDANRDAILESAGIRTLRFKSIPDGDKLKTAIEKLLQRSQDVGTG